MGGLCCNSGVVETVTIPLLTTDHDQFSSKSINTHDFTFSQLLGVGSFGKVLLVYKKDTG